MDRDRVADLIEEIALLLRRAGLEAGDILNTVPEPGLDAAPTRGH